MKELIKLFLYKYTTGQISYLQFLLITKLESKDELINLISLNATKDISNLSTEVLNGNLSKQEYISEVSTILDMYAEQILNL